MEAALRILPGLGLDCCEGVLSALDKVSVSVSGPVPLSSSMSESWGVKLLRLADEMGSGEMSKKYAVELTRSRWGFGRGASKEASISRAENHIPLSTARGVNRLPYR